MPDVIVMSDDGAVLMRERVTTCDFETEHASTALVQRVGWAVQDAVAADADEPRFSRSPGPAG